MNKKNKIIIFTSVILILLLLIGGTYAYYIWNTNEDEETIIATDVGAARVIYNAGSNLVGQSLQPVSDKSEGLKKEITVRVDKTIPFDTTFNLYMDIKVLGEGLKHESFKFEVYKDNELINSGNFSNEYLANNAYPCEEDNTISHIKIADNETITTTLSTYTLYIWIDGNMDNPTSMTSQSFSCKLHASGENGIIEEAQHPDITSVQEGTLAYKIVNDYNNSDKTSAINNNIRYYLDNEHLLMSDIGGNVRYYGGTYNYIYFNCDNYNNQTSDTCEVWRIIGVFGDKVKIMRGNSIGSFTGDYDYNDGEGATTCDNDWSNSSLMTLLNGAYLNNEDTEYYNGSTSATEIKFNTNGVGIKDNTRNLIADAVWNLGGCSMDPNYPDIVYKCERGSNVANKDFPLVWNGKIAIPYASDFAYSENINGKTNVPSSTWGGGTWFYPLVNRAGMHLLTSSSSNSNSGLLLYWNGGLGFYSESMSYPVLPTLFLNANLGINDIGDGSSGNPYQLVVNNE